MCHKSTRLEAKSFWSRVKRGHYCTTTTNISPLDLPKGYHHVPFVCSRLFSFFTQPSRCNKSINGADRCGDPYHPTPPNLNKLTINKQFLLLLLSVYWPAISC